MTTRHTRNDSSKVLDAMAADQGLLKRFAARFVGARDVEDVVQETFVRCFVASRAQCIQNPRAFMLRTAKNLALDAANRADSRLNSSLDALIDAGMLEPAGEDCGPEEMAAQRERFLVFCEAVAALPKACRRVFVLAKVYEMTQPEIAEYLNLSRKTVKNQIAKGMEATSAYMANHEASTQPWRESVAPKRRATGDEP